MGYSMIALLLQIRTPAAEPARLPSLISSTPDAETLLTRARSLTAAEPRCAVDPESTDITVCGLRNADRFRVPFTGYAPGDRRGEVPLAERDRLMAGRSIPCGQTAFTTNCGMAGMTVSSARGVLPGGARDLAP